MRANNYLAPEERRILLKVIKEYLTQYHSIKFAYIHGSFMEDLPFHDIDIAVYFEDTLSSEEQLDLALALSAELSHKLHLPVDVHALNKAAVAFSYEVTKGIMIISKDEEARLTFLEDTWKRYFDFEPLIKESLLDMLSP
jgi:predicted nucleotidyltransferase